MDTIDMTAAKLMTHEEICAVRYEQILGRNQYQLSSPYVSMVKYHDKDQDLLYLPERKNLVLSSTPNVLGKCMARTVMRSSLDGEARGQFDDVLSVQLARARFAILQIQLFRNEKRIKYLVFQCRPKFTK